MPLNFKQISLIKEELLENLKEKKIDKIEQPGKSVVILTLRGRSNDIKRLLICVSSNDIRVHLTEHKFENPVSPPMFCMLLRKHLTGARIKEITQPPFERILEFVTLTSTAMGDASSKKLIIEMFGRLPNIILTDSDNIIIDCLRRIGGDMQGKRMLLPGLRYHYPPPSPAPNPPLVEGAGDEAIRSESISQQLDETYTRKAKDDSMRQKSADLLKKMKTVQKRLLRKLTAQNEELKETGDRDYFRQCGELITANIYRMKKGDEVLIADDFYSQEDEKREIKLDITKTPQLNAAKFYKAYVKARNAEKYLTEQIKQGEKELLYVESVIELLERASSESELEEIRTELSETGYYREKSKKKIKKPVSKPNSFVSSSGFQILAGKNNIQNDKLTFKEAAKTDIWLHAQKIHGAHVIIRLDGKAPDDVTLREAAAVAAYFSAARSAGKVPVDYTQVKYVKKQANSRPGMVIYTDYKTITATPDEDLVKELTEIK
ncbi:MAG: NFACT family protein [Oscillospiraceae bacterium]|nr:NFACT family protein [Oscillospiraceae bacterium]